MASLVRVKPSCENGRIFSAKYLSLITWTMHPLKLVSLDSPADGEFNLVQWLCMIPEGSRAVGAFRIRFAFELLGFKDS
ncbi:unnamed protein product [Lasius platythorax]|uniref:Uncharacterized protein n=1 Tax=Lasius platythorax TaxID=488582 RepID=A0AAV2NET7_9HYME